MQYSVAAAILLAPIVLAAQSFSTEKGHAEFKSKVPMHSFTGKSNHLVGRVNLADSTVDFYIDLATFETGNGKRDKDMRKTLETHKYPFAEFFGKLVTAFDPSIESVQRAIVRGSFSIHGVTRTVDLSGTLRLVGENLQLSAEWRLNLEDYDIVPPSLLIMKVEEVQEIRIDANLGSAS